MKRSSVDSLGNGRLGERHVWAAHPVLTFRRHSLTRRQARQRGNEKGMTSEHDIWKTKANFLSLAGCNRRRWWWVCRLTGTEGVRVGYFWEHRRTSVCPRLL